MIIIGYSQSIEEGKLIEKNGLKYHPDTQKSYSGKSKAVHLNGQNYIEGTWKDG